MTEIDPRVISYRERYNLLEDRNPFGRASLDCINSQGDHGAFLRSGCYETLVAAGSLVTTAARDQQSCFILITGPDGTGRTSVANCLLHEYLRASQAAHGLLLVRAKVANASQKSCLLAWLGDFYEATQRNKQMDRQNLPDPLNLQPTISDSKNNEEDTPELISTGVSRLVRDVIMRKCAVGTVADKIRWPEHIRSLYVTLRRAPALTIFTGTNIGDLGLKLKTAFDGCADEGIITHHVRLDTVSGEMVKTLVKRWWENAAQQGYSEPPLHPDGVADGFGPPGDPIGRALNILEFIIDDLRDYPGKTYNKAQTAERIRRIRSLGMKLK